MLLFSLAYLLLTLLGLSSFAHSCRPSVWAVGLKEDQTIENHLRIVGRSISIYEHRLDINGYTAFTSNDDKAMLKAIRNDPSVLFVVKIPQDYFRNFDREIAAGPDEIDDEIYEDKLRPLHQWAKLQRRDPEVIDFGGRRIPLEWELRLEEGYSLDIFINLITNFSPNSVLIRSTYAFRLDGYNNQYHLRFKSEEQERKSLSLIYDDPRVEAIWPDRCIEAGIRDWIRIDEQKDQKKAQKSQAKQKKEPKVAQGGGKKKMEGAALIGIDVAKEDDLSEWYQQVITKGEMLEFTDVPGCYIYEPGSYGIYERIQDFFNTRIRKMGVRNCYFPLFISEANLQREKDHIEGFAAEVAWVTEGGKNKLEKRLAVRPTSETAMYGYFSKKIRSHRDLPLKLNQWNNVVRWEFKHPMPFIRSREFLWQEGHTAHMTEEDAGKEVLQILDYYEAIYHELLAVPVVKGRKTVAEQFPGAHYTTTVEGFIPSTGRGIQAGTSHCLGQHFAKMFDITVEDPHAKEGEKKEKLHVWQNSWGLTTRSIGIMILTHGDNKGLVIPPRVAEIQAIIVPVGMTAKTTPEDREKHYAETNAIKEVLLEAGVRAETDMRDDQSPGWKFNHWELKGVPLRIEFGPKDSAKHVVTVARRDQLAAGKSEIPIADLGKDVPALLETIQNDMFRKASDEFRDHRKTITKWEDFVPALNAKNTCLIPHCLVPDCEDEIKELSSGKIEGQEVDARAPSMGAKSLCIPFEQPAEGLVQGETKCTNPKCERKAEKWVMFGRSY
ncbi:unnamed protein product [Aureobasidium uvarum]|uniref:proline--tRNA ligase n=1 Tax=Aureobasidium uvarum TaxID=2773716 RepID=A0A9N8KD20_9PEZI|nr:unnamed protein product [Aureobasidium uvarum]